MAIVLAIATSCLYAGIRFQPKTEVSIWIDASRPIELVAPFHVDTIGENSERGLWIGPKVGRGWAGEAGGSARYKFTVPQGGTYQIWAYCLWHDPCTNAVYAQLDGQPKAIVGNDPIFNRWHWVRGFSVELTKGAHVLQLSNHSDNIAVQKVFLTNSPDTHPDRHKESFTDIFYDGFDGCSDGNFLAWTPREGQWTVVHPAEIADPAQKYLVGRGGDRALITIPVKGWSQYQLNASVRSAGSRGPEAMAALCFGLGQGGSGYQLRWRQGSRGDVATMELVRLAAGQSPQTLRTFSVPWSATEWHELEIVVGAGEIIVRVDGGSGYSAPCRGGAQGDIGLLVEGQGEVQFDSIHVRSIAGRQETKGESIGH